MHEDCGVVAVLKMGNSDKGGAAGFVHRALLSLQHRGEEAAGIAVWGGYGTGIQHIRGRGLVSKALPIYKILRLKSSFAIGHVRYSTVSADQTENIQPFIASTPYGKLAIAHNGNLKNADELRAKLESQGSLLSTTMDTELIAHLIAKSGKKTFESALKSACKKMEGAYSLTILRDLDLYAIRDPYGIRPLVLGRLGHDGFIVASETCALKAVNAEYMREIEPGELLKIKFQSLTSTQLLKKKKSGRCVFEMVYFSRPDSTTFSMSVHGARKKAGEILALEDKDILTKCAKGRPDIVVPVVDSGLPAAIGYSRASGIPFEIGLVRSHYIGRTFILPDQDSRKHSINLKLSAIPEVVRDKKVVLVDDSIVRGNTSKLIVQMVRDAGAKEVWVRVASPPIGWPCYLGIDTPNYDELIKNNTDSVDGIRDFIGADNLRYLSIKGLKQAVNNEDFCMGCMNGKYPV